MKTISGNCVSSKQISLSKAAKILSKFASAENGASQVISAYLHRASAAFNELNQLHKELKSPRSHKKHKRHKTEDTHDDIGRVVEDSVPSVETNQVMNHGRMQSKNEFKRQLFGSENADDYDEKSTQTIVKFSQELNGSVEYHAGNMDGSEKHKKNKKKKQEDESRHDRDSKVEFGKRQVEGKLPNRVQNEIERGRELANEGDGTVGMEEGKKQKREKKKKKEDREGTCSFSNNTCEVENLEGENAKGSEQQKKTEKNLCNSVEGESGGLVGPQDLQIKKKKKKYEAGNENKLYAEEVMMEKRKKRKNEDVEGRVEDRSGDITMKRMKRKHEGDS